MSEQAVTLLVAVIAALPSTVAATLAAFVAWRTLRLTRSVEKHTNAMHDELVAAAHKAGGAEERERARADED